MHTFETSKHFEKRVDRSGAIYYVLKTHVTPQQQAFYFVNASMDDSARFFMVLLCISSES